MAVAADIHNTNVVVGMKVELRDPTPTASRFLVRRKVTAIPTTNNVTLGSLGTFASDSLIKALEHADQEPVTGLDYASGL